MATYSDLDLNFVIHPIRQDINILQDDDAIIASVKNLVLTNKFEVPFAPEEGSNIRKVLFENWSPALDAVIAQLIAEVINNYEPRVSLQQIDVNFDEAGNGYNITIYFLNNLIPNQIFQGAFFLEKVR
jgi:phage baseplate assembly protein W